jgi:hypothetical protein
MTAIWTSLAVLCFAAPGVTDGPVSPPDLEKIDRAIKKEPAYAGQPRYGLLAFGSRAQTRVWLVLGKSKSNGDRYDVLYADLNANGDLTEPAERFEGEVDGNDVRFTLPDIKDGETGSVHTAFNVRASGEAPTVMVSLKWRDGFKMGGGYPVDPDDGYLAFADKPASAPVLWANGDGPFRFQLWLDRKLTIGAADHRNDLSFSVGQRGAGESSFWAFQEYVVPEGESLQATLIYHDAQGKEMRQTSLLSERC